MEITVTIPETSTTVTQDQVSPPSTPLTFDPELMTEFDEETILNKKKQSLALHHILQLTKAIHKPVYSRFASILQEFGFIKQNWQVIPS